MCVQHVVGYHKIFAPWKIKPLLGPRKRKRKRIENYGNGDDIRILDVHNDKTDAQVYLAESILIMI